MKFPNDIKYTKEHEWVKISDGVAYIGITEFAQSELGDIVFVDVDTLNEELDQEEVFGTIEAVKTVSDLFLPVSGEIIEFNEDLEDTPEDVNAEPYSKGWMIKMKISNPDDLNQLLDSNQYRELIGE